MGGHNIAVKDSLDIAGSGCAGAVSGPIPPAPSGAKEEASCAHG